jgi:hypothetical protein
MSEDILKKLEQRIDRRGFLRGSGLAAATLLGTAALPSLAAAQGQAPQEKPADKPAEGKDKESEKKDEKPADKPGDPNKEEDPFKVTKIDEKGKPYRMCPQCGFNMYQQEKIWTCENCGYSYSE